MKTKQVPQYWSPSRGWVPSGQFCAIFRILRLFWCFQQRDDLAAHLSSNLEEISALEEEREQNFTLLMNAFARVDQLAKSVFGEQIYSLLLDSMKATANQVGQMGPLPMVFGVGQSKVRPAFAPRLSVGFCGNTVVFRAFCSLLA